MSNSSFTSLGDANLKTGGGLYLTNTNITIDYSTFKNNTAIEGGAIYYSWSDPVFWVVTVSNSNFINNNAIQAGGAIKYNFYRPILGENTEELIDWNMLLLYNYFSL